MRPSMKPAVRGYRSNNSTTLHTVGVSYFRNRASSADDRGGLRGMINDPFGRSLKRAAASGSLGVVVGWVKSSRPLTHNGGPRHARPTLRRQAGLKGLQPLAVRPYPVGYGG